MVTISACEYGEEYKNVEKLKVTGEVLSGELAGFFCKFNGRYLDLRELDVRNAFTTRLMFGMCKNLEEILIPDFSRSKIGSMADMFNGCVSLKKLDLSALNTESTVNMGYMFKDCKSLESLDLSNFCTDNVINMNSMFKGCKKLKNLNISTFDTRNVIDMSKMFYGCESLEFLDISHFDMSNLMDEGAYNLNYTKEGTSTFIFPSDFDITKLYDFDKIDEADKPDELDELLRDVDLDIPESKPEIEMSKSELDELLRYIESSGRV